MKNNPSSKISPLALGKTLQVFGQFFFATVAVCLLVELLLLPHFLQQWHWGKGLLQGPGDWLYYHDSAEKLSRTIQANGLSAIWENFYELRFVGVFSVLYYFLGASPVSLIPMVAFLNAVMALQFFSILSNEAEKKISLWCLLPLLCFPLSVFLLTQPLKDIFFLTGFSIFLSTLYFLLRKSYFSAFDLVQLAVKCFAFTFLFWLTRPYYLRIAELFVFMAVSWQLVRLLFSRPNTVNQRSQYWQTVALCFLCFFSLELGLRVKPWKVSAPDLTAQSTANTLVFTDIVTTNAAAPMPQVYKNSAEIYQGTEFFNEPPTARNWQETSLLPRFLDLQLQRLADLRHGYLNTAPEAPTAIDIDREFHSASDFVRYFPRALQIGLLAPFPIDWLGSQSKPMGKFFRFLSGIEMLIFYFCLLGVFYLFWKKRVSSGLLFCLLVCVFSICLYSFTVNNVGTLVRMRYGMLLFIACLGLTAWPEILHSLRRSRANRFGLFSKSRIQE